MVQLHHLHIAKHPYSKEPIAKSLNFTTICDSFDHWMVAAAWRAYGVVTHIQLGQEMFLLDQSLQTWRNPGLSQRDPGLRLDFTTSTTATVTTTATAATATATATVIVFAMATMTKTNDKCYRDLLNSHCYLLQLQTAIRVGEESPDMKRPS